VVSRVPRLAVNTSGCSVRAWRLVSSNACGAAGVDDADQRAQVGGVPDPVGDEHQGSTVDGPPPMAPSATRQPAGGRERQGQKDSVRRPTRAVLAETAYAERRAGRRPAQADERAGRAVRGRTGTSRCRHGCRADNGGPTFLRRERFRTGHAGTGTR
jgi:hypothetical protein